MKRYTTLPSMLTGFFAGAIFGLGLWVGGMTEPENVQGFLDILDDWNPALAFVLGAAVLVSLLSYQWVSRLQQPVLSESFEFPSSRVIDSELIIGAIVFGIGWGLAGYCPGPALVSLGQGSLDALMFALFMVIGMFLYSRFGNKQRDKLASTDEIDQSRNT